MNYRNLMTITAVIAIVSGLFIALYVGIAFRLFLPDIPWPRPIVSDREAMSFWAGVAFVRMFGVMLAGFGCLVFGLRRIRDVAIQRSITNKMILAGSICCAMALMQWKAIWEPASGLILPGGFFVMVIAFGWLRLGGLKVVVSQTDRLQSEWERQISKAAAQQERNRLARDLHDSIKQQIFSINVSAATAQVRLESDLSGTRAALDEVRRGAREAMVEMEAMLQHLRPAPLENVGLVEALRKQCEALQSRTGATVTSELGSLPKNECLPPGAQETLFRIGQEALANIARHARAQTVQLRLFAEPDGSSLWLKISDDGQGFNPVTVNEGMGLSNIRSRAQEIGAELQVESAPGSGTHTVVRIPIVSAKGEKIRRILHRSAVVWLVGGPLIAAERVVQPWYYILTAPMVYLVIYLATLMFFLQGSINQLQDIKEEIPRKLYLELQRYAWQVGALGISVVLWNRSFSNEKLWFPSLSPEMTLLLVTIPWRLFFLSMVIGMILAIHFWLKEEDSALSPRESRRRDDTIWKQGKRVVAFQLIAAGALFAVKPDIGLIEMMLAGTSYLAYLYWWRRKRGNE